MKLTKFFTFLAIAATTMVGCGPTDGPQGGGETGGVKLKADKNTVEVGSTINFTVTNDAGEDVTSSAVIYNKTLDFTEVENPYVTTIDGTFEFYAVAGSAISESIKVTVVPTIPALPEDSNPSSTSFNHRILLVDHTGNTCGYCPQMMKALKEVAETGNYHSKYYEAMAHSYAATDPAYSPAASAVSGYYGVNSYPTLTYNLQYSVTSSFNAEHIKAQIDAQWKESAEAGIAASASISPAGTIAVVNAEVKAAVANDYRINAWLLEDGVYAKQINASEEWMNTHNNCIRQLALNEPLSGIDLGRIEAGKSASTTMTLGISNKAWNTANLKVMLIATSKNSAGKYEVANVTICPMNESVNYDYK